MRTSIKILFISILLFLPTLSFAIDTGVDTHQSLKQDKEKSLSEKKHKEEKKSEGKKKSKSISKGLDKQTQEAIKKAENMMKSQGIDVSLSLEAIFVNDITAMEQDWIVVPKGLEYFNNEKFKSCKVLSLPKLPKDFGISPEIRPGVIDSIKASYLSSAAHANSSLEGIIDDEEPIREYLDCLAYYGAVIGQAYLYMNDFLQELEITIEKDKEGYIDVIDIGYDDFMGIAREALRKVLTDGFKNKTIKHLYKNVVNFSAETNCRFDGQITVIQCGPSQINLSAKPQLINMGVVMYGGSYAGFHGTYKVSKSWSFNDAIEKLKSTNTYKKFAEDVSKYSEELESKGKSKDAVMVRKKAWELAKSGKQNISLSQLLPKPGH